MSADNYLYITKGKILDRRLSDDYEEGDNTSGYLLFETKDPEEEVKLDFLLEWANKYAQTHVVEYGFVSDDSINWDYDN